MRRVALTLGSLTIGREESMRSTGSAAAAGTGVEAAAANAASTQKRKARSMPATMPVHHEQPMIGA
jgi:hypothetical protein